MMQDDNHQNSPIHKLPISNFMFTPLASFVKSQCEQDTRTQMQKTIMYIFSLWYGENEPNDRCESARTKVTQTN